MTSSITVDHFNEIWRRKNGEDSSLHRYVRGRNERVDKAIDLVPSGRRLLDIGCGPGTMCAQVSDRFEAVFGLEIAEAAALIAKSFDVHSVVSNFGNTGLPFSTGSFDTVTALSSIQYAIDPMALLKECHRVLTSNGALVLSVPNMRTVGKIFRLAVHGKFPGTSRDGVGYDGGTLHYFCFRDVVRLIREAGFLLTERHSLYCRPGFVARIPDIGPVDRLRNEFFSGEMFLICRKTG